MQYELEQVFAKNEDDKRLMTKKNLIFKKARLKHIFYVYIHVGFKYFYCIK